VRPSVEVEVEVEDSGFDESFANGPAAEVNAVDGADGAHDAVFVAFDGLFRDFECSRDLRDAASVGDAKEDIPLSVCEFFHLGAGEAAEASTGADFDAVSEMFGEHGLTSGNLSELLAESSHGFFAGEEAGDAIMCDEVELAVGESIGEYGDFCFAEAYGEFGEDFSNGPDNDSFTNQDSGRSL
jgi:hypothetical protein